MSVHRNKTKDSYFQKREDNFVEWVSYWRENPEVFARDYLGVKLHLYQEMLLHMMEKKNYFMYIAARGRIPCPDQPKCCVESRN